MNVKVVDQQITCAVNVMCRPYQAEHWMARIAPTRPIWIRRVIAVIAPTDIKALVIIYKKLRKSKIEVETITKRIGI